MFGIFPTDTMPPWPKHIPRVFKPVARLKHGIGYYSKSDLRAIEKAAERMEAYSAIKCSALTGTWTENIFRNHADYTAVTANGTETNMLAGTHQYPTLPALFFDQVAFRSVSVIARGVLSTTTGPPTLTINTYFSTSQEQSSAWTTNVGQSTNNSGTATMTTVASQTNVFWELRQDITCLTQGQTTGQTTLLTAGYFTSPYGLASPFTFALVPSAAAPSTWNSATIDDSVTQYYYITGKWSSASNSITCKYLRMDGLN